MSKLIATKVAVQDLQLVSVAEDETKKEPSEGEKVDLKSVNPRTSLIFRGII